MQRSMTVLSLFALAAAMCGCGLLDAALPIDAAESQRLANLRYPQTAPLGEDLDIRVVRDRRWINLANLTPRAYDKPYLWLNRQYVAQVGRITVGTGNRFVLTHFINEHGEPFPIGALLAPDKARPLISADLFDPTSGQMHRLLVRTAGQD